MMIIYTGHGKGKTTAALGLIFRSLGYKHRVGVVQFIKGKWQTGERLFASDVLNLDFHVMGLGFTWDSDDLSRDRQAAAAAWEKGKSMIESGEYRLIVLDEISYAFNYDFISPDDLLLSLAQKSSTTTLVLTGRNMPSAICDKADLITEMSLVRHPFQKGAKAVQGIDY